MEPDRRPQRAPSVEDVAESQGDRDARARRHDRYAERRAEGIAALVEDVDERKQRGRTDDGRSGPGHPKPRRLGETTEEEFLIDRRDDRSGEQIHEEAR